MLSLLYIGFFSLSYVHLNHTSVEITLGTKKSTSHMTSLTFFEIDVRNTYVDPELQKKYLKGFKCI